MPRASRLLELMQILRRRRAPVSGQELSKALGLKVLQQPTDMPFGFTLVVEDTDGHRLRPFVLAERPR
ncbi:hypothetical protein [Corallococcus carmarthensis]|uniref:hypothetical protein n=1 Tax=Corallococcus carmarthensis TaxID=2316728 RepID=UPI00148C658E|nr:hypothetical protein [Corallococcus carmarthensis]NOK15567.1 hypothetical protein [Corallococcus carmarthensis]